jgi:hypothetical protein
MCNATRSRKALKRSAILCDRRNYDEQTLMIEPGLEMYQPSMTALGLTNEAGALAAATIGGSLDL